MIEDNPNWWQYQHSNCHRKPFGLSAEISLLSLITKYTCSSLWRGIRLQKKMTPVIFSSAQKSFESCGNVARGRGSGINAARIGHGCWHTVKWLRMFVVPIPFMSKIYDHRLTGTCKSHRAIAARKKYIINNIVSSVVFRYDFFMNWPLKCLRMFVVPITFMSKMCDHRLTDTCKSHRAIAARKKY